MGDFRDIISDGLELIDELTRDDLQVDVRHERWLSQSASGTPVYASAETTQAFVEYINRQIRTTGGKEVMAKAWIMFVRPRTLGLKDRLTLPNGQTGPILDTEGFADRSTDDTFYKEVFLG